MSIIRKRVVITGMGVLSSIATNIEEFKQALFDKKTGIEPSEKYLKYFADANASEILQQLEYKDLSPEFIETMDNAALWAYYVGCEALVKADLINNATACDDMGMVIGVSSAGTEAYLPIIEHRFESFSLQKSMLTGSYSSCGAIVSSLLGIKGGVELVATACTASVNAIGIGFDQIQNDKNQTVLVVGTEPLYLPTFSGFYGLHAMKKTPATPFSGTPGMSIGEGAGAILLEDYDHAIARGATIYGEIISYATSSDAHHETAPDPRGDGAAQVMMSALSNANLQPGDIEYINAHGTGTEANDKAETIAMKKVFPNIMDIPVSSTKAYFGHNIGSAGIIELIACLLTLPENKVLPTLNFNEPRIGCDLNYVPNDFLDRNVKLFMKNNYAFGGNNCCIIASHKPGVVPTTSYESKRVAVTGVGAITSLGHDLESIIANARSGRLGGGLVPLVEESEAREEFLSVMNNIAIKNKEMSGAMEKLGVEKLLEAQIWTHHVKDLDPRKYLRRFDPRKANPICTFALIAMTQALKAAGRKIKRDGHDLGMILGMSKGPQNTIHRYLMSLYPDPNKVRTSDFPGSLINAAATFCAISEGIKGYNTTLSSGANSSLGALSYGYEIIRQNLQPQMIVGGADENLAGLMFYIQVLNESISLSENPDAFQVYSQTPKGSLLGEGSGMLFLEDYQAAKERGAEILAEVIGYGKSSDAGFFAPEQGVVEKGEALAKAIRQAVDDAGISLDEIDLICGSSIGTTISDRVELDAIRNVFGSRSKTIPLVNYNGYFGFVESAIGVLNAAFVIESMRSGEILPIPHTQNFIADDMLFVTQPMQKSVNVALLLGSSDGGAHFAFLLKKDNAL